MVKKQVGNAEHLVTSNFTQRTAIENVCKSLYWGFFPDLFLQVFVWRPVMPVEGFLLTLDSGPKVKVM